MFPCGSRCEVSFCLKMSLSLVAYDSSDEENEENETSSEVLSNPSMISCSTNDKKEEEEEKENEECSREDFKHFLHILPKPKVSDSKENIEQNDDILLKKEIKCQPIPLGKKQTIKITVPSLSQFKDIEEENEKKLTKIIQSSQKGCGLFDLLVPPKKENKSLIPQAVKNAAKLNDQQSTILQTAIKGQRANSKKESTEDRSCNELLSNNEEDIAAAAADFFGLTVNKSITNDFTTELLDSNIEETSSVKHMEDRPQNPSCSNFDVSTSNESNNSNKTLISNVMNLPKEEIILKNKAEVGPKLPIPEQEYNIDVKGNVAFDEKAIEYLCGKRGVKRKKEIDDVNIIEINGEDIKPNEREWLVKALTEEPIQRPVSMQSCGINSQSKKKHQITYLAHQAKAMELELKNQWSQNRMARKQAKSKYGF